MTEETPRQRRGYRFGVFEADLLAGALLKNGLKVRLQEQPFRLLTLLLEKPGEVVTRDDIRERLWPDGTYVDFDRSLSTAASKLREALGDSASSPRFIETLPRRGYRFLASVETAGGLPIGESAEAKAEAGSAGGLTPEREFRRQLRWAGSLAVIASVAMVAAVVVAVLWMAASAPTVKAPLRRFAFTPSSLSSAPYGRVVISPDGQHIVYLGADDEQRLWVRDVDREQPRELAGTEGALQSGLFWSPDSQFIGFAASNELKKVSVQGGPAITLYQRPGRIWEGGSWSHDGDSIVFSSGSGFPVLHEVPARERGAQAVIRARNLEKGAWQQSAAFPAVRIRGAEHRLQRGQLHRPRDRRQEPGDGRVGSIG